MTSSIKLIKSIKLIERFITIQDMDKIIRGKIDRYCLHSCSISDCPFNDKLHNMLVDYDQPEDDFKKLSCCYFNERELITCVQDRILVTAVFSIIDISEDGQKLVDCIKEAIEVYIHELVMK